MRPVLWIILGVPAGYLARFLLGCNTRKWHWNLLCGTAGAALAAAFCRACSWAALDKADLYTLLLAIIGACVVQGLTLWLRCRLDI